MMPCGLEIDRDRPRVRDDAIQASCRHSIRRPRSDRHAATPIHGCYAQYLCLPARKLVAVPVGLDPAEAVALVLNYITAYQMLHRSAKASLGQRMLIHGASGGVGSAMLQLAKLAGVEMYGMCSARWPQWSVHSRQPRCVGAGIRTPLA
jgi:NADPH:quinone reductase-like Zn-dependent oxidoreductase